MSNYKSFRATRKALAPGRPVTAREHGVTPDPLYNPYPGYLDSFLGQMRSRTPSLINYDKIAMAQNYAGAIFLPISFAANQLGRAKPVIYEHTNDPKDPDGKKRLPRFDPIYNLFKRPNPNDTLRMILYSMSMQKDLTGECYVWLPPEDSQTGLISEFGEPLEMYVIPSAWVSGLGNCPWWEGGAYQVTPYISQSPRGAQSAYIPADQMIRIYDPHPLYDKVAYSVLQAISQCVDTVRSIDQARASTQINGCQQSIAIELDPQMQNPSVVDMKRVRETFNQIYSGASNAGKPLLIPAGAKVQKISTTPEDMAWEKGWDQLSKNVYANYHMNQAALGLSPDMTYATLYASLKQLYWSKFEPWLECTAQAFDKGYFEPYVGDDYFIEFELPKINDEQILLSKLKLLCDNGSITHGMLLRDLGMEVDPEVTPWLNERVGSGKAPAPGAGANDEQRQDPDVEASRPRPSDLSGDGIDTEKLFSILDREKHRGTIRNGNGRHN